MICLSIGAFWCHPQSSTVLIAFRTHLEFLSYQLVFVFFCIWETAWYGLAQFCYVAFFPRNMVSLENPFFFIFLYPYWLSHGKQWIRTDDYLRVLLIVLTIIIAKSIKCVILTCPYCVLLYSGISLPILPLSGLICELGFSYLSSVMPTWRKTYSLLMFVGYWVRMAGIKN